MQNHIFTFGLNFRSANLELREKLAFSGDTVRNLLKNLKRDFSESEIALLTTCNRTEFYLSAPNYPNLPLWLEKNNLVKQKELEGQYFFYQDREAVRHLYRVACGLDSLILGEPQILGQIKNAYSQAKELGVLGSKLERLFQQSFAVVKQIRHYTKIGKNPVSVVYAGIKLTQQFFDDYKKRSVLIIGAGETGELAFRYLKDLEFKKIIIANRTVEKAQNLANQAPQALAIPLDKINEVLAEVDLIIGAINTDRIILNQLEVKQALKKRSFNLQLYLDLSMPRIFNKDIEELSPAFLYGIDDLEQIIEEGREERLKAAKEAETFLNLFSDDYIAWLNSKPQHNLIKNLRDNANVISQELLSEAKKKLHNGENPETVLETLSYKLTKKLLHYPSVMISSIPPDHKDWLDIIADSLRVSNEK